MGYVGIHAQMQYRSLKPGNLNDSHIISHTTKHIVHQSNNNMSANGMPTAFQFDMLP
jgi:hypothetical protein